MFKKIFNIVSVVILTYGVFMLGYTIGINPVAKQEIIEVTDSLQETMLDAYDRAEAEE